jgi:hypothetical protein
LPNGGAEDVEAIGNSRKTIDVVRFEFKAIIKIIIL